MKYLNKNPIDSWELKAISRTMFVTLLVTMECDIKCWYCDVLPVCEDIPRIDPPPKHISLEEFNSLLDFMEYNSKRPNLSLHFFGGEPTLNPHINEMAKRFKKRFLNKKNIQILLTTNLNRPNKYWFELDNDIRVAASYHNEKVIDKRWFRKAEILYEKKQLHHIVLMLTNKNKYNILTAYEKYYKKMPCIICPISQFIDTKDYKKFKERVILRLDHDPFEDSEKELFYEKRSRKPIHMCSSGLIIDEYGFINYCWNRKEINKESIFKNPKQRIPIWHTCRNYTDNCDKEVIRSSVSFYNRRIKNNELDKKEYTKEELKKFKPKKILMRCNG